MRRNLLGVVAVALLLAAVLPASPQSSQQENKPPEKKKTRKVWTNDDMEGLKGNPISVVGTVAPSPKEEEKKAAQTPPGEASAELEKAREEQRNTQELLEFTRQDLETLRAQQGSAGDDAERDTFRRAIEEREAQVAQAEQQLQELNARVAELEKQAKGRKRPASKAAPKPAAAPAPATPPSS